MSKQETSECSKELRELSDKDYRELLASVAGLPIRTLSSESGGLSGGDVLTSARENEKLTPAARSCLEKIVGEIENNNNFVDTKRTRTGKCATFDDSFMTRRIEAFSAFSSTKKKPVRYEKEDMKFIDEDK
ncbi:unnamed protein product [Nippostrongylus brasiliensis]|uniref:Uncharacterized protein n=1 Tax=Nippostrongylus brasiliensis TaxID=27835 RepID=A0A0N4YQR8_NIPBR|nr:unnamed protein product [Nippostrongylus brasiliensis]